MFEYTTIASRTTVENIVLKFSDDANQRQLRKISNVKFRNIKSLTYLRVCGCVFTSIHRKGFICLNQLGNQGTDQRCYVDDVSFLSQVPSSLLRMKHLTFLTSHFTLLAHQKRAKPRINQCTSGFQNMRPSFTIKHYIVS